MVSFTQSCTIIKDYLIYFSFNAIHVNVRTKRQLRQPNGSSSLLQYIFSLYILLCISSHSTYFCQLLFEPVAAHFLPQPWNYFLFSLTAKMSSSSTTLQMTSPTARSMRPSIPLMAIYSGIHPSKYYRAPLVVRVPVWFRSCHYVGCCVPHVWLMDVWSCVPKTLHICQSGNLVVTNHDYEKRCGSFDGFLLFASVILYNFQYYVVGLPWLLIV